MKPRVLVLDDEPAVARSVRRTLMTAGFDVEAVNDLNSAREKLAGSPFAVIISDERMPEGSGVDFLAECARIHPDTSRILLTGYADAQTAAEAINRAAIFRLLFKPWVEDDFISAIREAAWRYSLIQDAPDGEVTPVSAPIADFERN